MCACKYLIGHRSTLPDDKALFCEKKSIEPVLTFLLEPSVFAPYAA